MFNADSIFLMNGCNSCLFRSSNKLEDCPNTGIRSINTTIGKRVQIFFQVLQFSSCTEYCQLNISFSIQKDFYIQFFSILIYFFSSSCIFSNSKIVTEGVEAMKPHHEMWRAMWPRHHGDCQGTQNGGGSWYYQYQDQFLCASNLQNHSLRVTPLEKHNMLPLLVNNQGRPCEQSGSGMLQH